MLHIASAPVSLHITRAASHRAALVICNDTGAEAICSQTPWVNMRAAVRTTRYITCSFSLFPRLPDDEGAGGGGVAAAT